MHRISDLRRNLCLFSDRCPPVETWLKAPEDVPLHRAYQIFATQLERVEYLLGFADDPFRATTDPAQGILAITAVHPMREEEALSYIQQMGGDTALLEELVQDEKLTQVEYNGRRFYIRRLQVN